MMSFGALLRAVHILGTCSKAVLAAALSIRLHSNSKVTAAVSTIQRFTDLVATGDGWMTRTSMPWWRTSTAKPAAKAERKALVPE